MSKSIIDHTYYVITIPNPTMEYEEIDDDGSIVRVTPKTRRYKFTTTQSCINFIYMMVGKGYRLVVEPKFTIHYKRALHKRLNAIIQGGK